MGENPDAISFYSFNDGSYLIRVQDQELFDSGSAQINDADSSDVYSTTSPTYIKG